jgi:hypothetical protein
MGLGWSDLSTKLVAQVMMFALRYIPNINYTIGPRNTSFKLTGDGSQSYDRKDFFPETLGNNRKDIDYIPEMIQTARSELGLGAVLKFFNVKSLEELGKRFDIPSSFLSIL